ncbi:MAG: FtsX-like permease family protein [Acidobacteria bacterium]|nr:FtsX-like permease family protein [Acidobacteriota bacterium]
MAVLCGSFVVGHSVRSSLRRLALERIGRTERALIADVPFRERLAAELAHAVPILAFEGIATAEIGGRAANRVSVYGVDERFFRFHNVPVDPPAASQALLSDALARELGLGLNEALRVRIEKPSAIPAESLHGRKENASRSMRAVVRQIVPPPLLGEFSLRPRQGPVYAVFLPLRRLQRDLGQERRVNTLLIAGGADGAAVVKQRYRLEDLGLKLRPLSSGGYSLESSATMLNDRVASAALEAASAAGVAATPVFAYVVNTIRGGGREIPYSTVAGINLPELKAGGEIALNEWAARELRAGPGDPVTLEYYVWDPSGRLNTKTAAFRLAGALPMRGVGADRELVPEYPGITDSASISGWDPPFPINLGRIRKSDEEYWNRYRAAPKAFLRLERAQQLWSSRFGRLTAIRIATATPQPFEDALHSKLDPFAAGMTIVNAREQALAASQGATDFAEYFSYFSFFLVVSALLLTGLFFRFTIEQRTREIGLLKAAGFPPRRLMWLFLREGTVVALAGSALGLIAAVAYGALIVHGLRTWWFDAVGTDRIGLYVAPGPLLYGFSAAFLIAVLALAASLRSLRRIPARDLLTGSHEVATPSRRRLRFTTLAGLLAAGTGLALAAASASGAMPATGGFFGAGALCLIAAASLLWRWLAGRKHHLVRGIAGLGFRSAAYRPGRSVLCVTLIAAATFLIIAIDSFRRGPDNSALDRRSGTGGFPLVAESAVPLYWNPNTPEGRENLNLPPEAAAGVRFVPFRLRPGDDTSCLNLYQPRDPRIIAPPAAFVRERRFDFAASLAETAEQRANPWLLLESAPGGGVIPAIADATSLQYALHKKVGDRMELPGSGVKLQFVAALRDSVLQSEIVVSETNFVNAFPEQQGYRFFLLEAPPERAAEVIGPIEQALSDYGFDIQSAPERLAAYHRVENTYLSTFQALGGLGLVLGTIGLGAVLLRNVLERRRELALLRALGYRPEHLRLMIVAENAFLLIIGVGIGVACAALAVAPVWSRQGGQARIASMLLLLLAVLATGLLASLLAVRYVNRAELIPALRSE